MNNGNYWLPTITGEAKAQEGGGTTRVWIADTKVYPGIYQCLNDRVLAAGTMVTTDHFVKNVGFFVIILAMLF